MILDLRQFETFPVNTVIEGIPERVSVDFDSFKRIVRVSQQLNIQKSGDEYFCQGTLTAEVELECARCLNKFVEKISTQLDFIACSEDVYAQRAYKDTEDYALFQGGDLVTDISDIVRQAIILSVSLKPLCSEECKGLCSSCGINLNEGSCNCKKETIDPRWEALKQLSGKTLQKKE